MEHAEQPNVEVNVADTVVSDNLEPAKPVEDDIVILDPSSNDRMIAEKDVNIDAVMLPTSIYADLLKTIEVIEKADIETINSNYTTDDRKAVAVLTDGLRVTVRNNSLVKTLRDQEARWMQEPKYADKVINLRELTMGSNKPGGRITGPVAAARFYTELGLGGLIQIPMWHSGFHITLKAIKETELTNLLMSIANNQITLGRDTNTLIFSNYSVVFVRLVTEFITRHIQSCTLTLTNINDVTKFIKIQDLPLMVNGLIQAIYLKGFNDVRSCINTTIIDPTTTKPKCNYKVTSVIDPKKLLWLNRRALSDKQLEHMLKRAPNSMTENEVLEYQSTLKVNKPTDKKINTENGRYLTVNIEAPYLDKHIVSGERWVKDVITLTEKLFTEDLDIEEKNYRVRATSKTTLLNVYRHFINSIALEDGSKVEGDDDIAEILEIITSDKVAFKELLKEVKEYIDINTIAIIAIPNFKCPNCKEDQHPDALNQVFKDLIPLNVLELFFDLSTLKNSAILERNLD